MERQPRALHARRIHAGHGFTLVELLVVIAIIGVLAAIAIPRLLGSREKAWEASCDDNYKAIAGEFQNELDSENAKGNPNAASDVLDRVVPRHIDDDNPRNKADAAYVNNHACTPFIPTATTSCQVFYCFEGSSTIVTQQYEVSAVRTFAISVQ